MACSPSSTTHADDSRDAWASVSLHSSAMRAISWRVPGKAEAQTAERAAIGIVAAQPLRLGRRGPIVRTRRGIVEARVAERDQATSRAPRGVGHDVAVGGEHVEGRAGLDEVAAAVVGQRGEVDEVERTVGHDQHERRIGEPCAQRIP